MEGWITLHRKFLDWEWFDDDFMVKLFLYLLLSANHEQKKWHGITIERGQLLTGRIQLSEKLHVSEQRIRTAITRLKSTGEITTKSTNKYSIITICKYDSYQNKDFANNQQNNQQSNQRTTNKQPTNNQQLTTNNNDNNDNNIESVYAREENFSEKLLLDQTWIEQMAMQLHNPTGDAVKNIELIAHLIQEANLAFQADGDYPHDYSSFRQRCRMYIVRHYKRMLNDLKMLNNNLKPNNYGNTQSCARQIGSDNPDDYRVEWAKY